MMNGLSFDIEDWFQVENLRSAISRERWSEFPLRVEASTQRILSILAENQTKATFFFLGWVADRCPDLVRQVHKDGHEVACHGYGHELVYRLTPAELREDLRRSKRPLEDLIGAAVLGYRAPSFSITEQSLWATDVLMEEGFAYDSSVFPVSIHDRYGLRGASRRPFRWPSGLLEIPLAVYQLGPLALPVAGGGYFRLLPYLYFRALLGRLNSGDEQFTFYMHPWELDPDQPRVKVPWRYSFRHYVNLKSSGRNLGRLIRDFDFAPMATAYHVAA